MAVDPSLLPSSLPLDLVLQPDVVEWIQETYLDTLGPKLLATALLLVLILIGAASASRVYDALRQRYGPKLGEVVSLLILGIVTMVVVYSFSAIWEVLFVLEFTLQAATIDRWEAAQQIITLGIAATAYLAIRFVNRSIDTLAETSAVTKHQSEVAHHVADVAIIAAAATVILSLWGINLTNIFLGAGAITAIVALTARETLAAMLAGFVLLFSRPFHVGDWIEVNETSGIVTDVTIFTTKIQTFDDKHVLVPNDEVTSSQLTNYSRNNQLRVEVEVGVDYDADVSRAREIIVEAVDDLEMIKSSPNPQVVTKAFGDSSILLECHVWIGNPTKRRTHDARTAVIEAVADAFDREGISIPYPHRVHSPRGDGFRIESGTREEAGLSTTDD
ncbi:mechanosensitive ion channel MscS [Natronococcus amylolyticus DSM 10524]|uniref:Mechanosensitive ion channel MscS n=1 Tax=Natronococcus amylolyticus DSM 10524 TaxID=1227497 RepID=L9XA15_9EURY|nr:mechanosensitive ion channel family protein [Natronococcus amylolyticus]ELY58462.1 mechanosensitive ion channel MscS [Natronococcus amylolyticus DSM 10524]